jgi:hypothetical protein
VLAGTSWAHAASDRPTADTVRSLRIEPPELKLTGANREQHVLVTAEFADGRARDVTLDCALTTDDPAVAKVEGGRVTGVAGGTTVLRIGLGAHRARAVVEVEDRRGYPPIHFGSDIVPLFSKLGCNGGGCHGKASGQNGFRLSVFGHDPAGDYDALVKEGRGRRVFPARPEQSLLLLKAAARVPHGGGRRLDTGSFDYELILEWVRQGMPVGDPGAPRLVGLRVSPAGRVLGFDARQQILATAVYSDGSLRDVTSAAAYTSNAGQLAEVDARGRVRTGRTPGETAVTVNYMGQVAVVRIQVPRPERPDPFPDLPAAGPIDTLVWAKLSTMGIVPSDPADDATFLRRLWLDTVGTLPDSDDVRVFLADRRPDKRARMIDAVLDRDEYADYWALKWADLLLVDRDNLGDRGAFEFHRWLRARLAKNRPYDQWVRELVSASGDSGANGPVNFFRALRTPEEITESVSQVFLGVRVQCARCHHHPFEKWSQADFYGMVGFFGGLERKKVGEGRELVFPVGHRQATIPLTNQPVPTRPLDGEAEAPPPGSDPRLRLAGWLTDPENPWFARLLANRLWKHFLGRGLVEPEDDLRTTNPATNEPLLDHLARQVVASRFDLKAVMRLILNARVYQLSGATTPANRDDDQNYSHHYARRLPAEVLLDAVSQVTGVSEPFPGRPAGTRAIQLWDNRMPSYFLDVFGRPERNSPCECGRSGEPTMAQALHLMNAPEIEAKLASPSGRVDRLIDAGKCRDEIVEELCLAALGRPAGAKERRVAAALFDQAPPREAAADFLWTLFNSYEFLFIH